MNDTNQTPAKITREHVEGMILKTTYTLLPSGRCMVCEMTLVDGNTDVFINLTQDKAEAVVAAQGEFREKLYEILGEPKDEKPFDFAAGNFVDTHKLLKTALRVRHTLTIYELSRNSFLVCPLDFFENAPIVSGADVDALFREYEVNEEQSKELTAALMQRLTNVTAK